MPKHYLHNPPHLFVDEQLYFITGSTLYRTSYLENDKVKEELISIIYDFLTRKGWRLDHWVILDNHYHLTVESKEGKDLGTIFGNIHRKSAKIVRAFMKNGIQKKVWHNYWDRCIRDEKQYDKFLNYMFWNPVKHNKVDDPLDYEWSSFHWLFKKGVEVNNWDFLRSPMEDLSFIIPKE
jgi:putative transposase